MPKFRPDLPAAKAKRQPRHENPLAAIQRDVHQMHEDFHTLLELLRVKPPSPTAPVTFRWTVGQAQPKSSAPTMLELQITNEQKITVTLTPVTATGQPAKLDGVPTWTVQSGDATVVVAEDGLSASLVSSDTPGDTQVLVEADANLGEGVETISDIITLRVAGANAANLGLVAGTPEPK